MCALLTLLITGPRFLMIFWYLIWPRPWETAFQNAIVPILGFIFLPWITLMYVAVASDGDVSGTLDFVLLAIAFIIDLSPLATRLVGPMHTRGSYY